MPMLPSELWAMILTWCAPDAYYPLLFVSRQVHAIAKPWLLRTVDLRIPFAMRSAFELSIIQFHNYISAPNEHRQRLVHSLSIDFLQDIPFPIEIQALDQLIPTLTNLRSLTLRFTEYSPALHGPLRLFKEGISGVSLTALVIVVDDTDNEPDITGLLRSQPSIQLLNLSGSFSKVENDQSLLPALQSLYLPLDVRIYDPHLYRDKIVHLSAMFYHNMRSILRLPANNLTTISCLAETGTNFRAFAPMAPNLTYLEIHVDRDFERAVPWTATLSPLRHTKIKHIRFPIHVQWISEYARSKDIFSLECFPSSLQCVELAVDQDASDTPSEGPPCNLRWYRGRGNPVKVRWNCAASEIWHADWERDVMGE